MAFSGAAFQRRNHLLILRKLTIRAACCGPEARPRAALDRATRNDTIMINGTVKFFNATKGFGFISPADGSKEAFVHISAVERAGLTGLAEGQNVTYELENGRDGKASAIDLRLS